MDLIKRMVMPLLLQKKRKERKGKYDATKPTGGMASNI